MKKALAALQFLCHSSLSPFVLASFTVPLQLLPLAAALDLPGRGHYFGGGVVVPPELFFPLSGFTSKRPLPRVSFFAIFSLLSFSPTHPCPTANSSPIGVRSGAMLTLFLSEWNAEPAQQGWRQE
jgi:hypothetical protein